MVQSLKSKVTKLAQAYSISAIIDTAKQVQQELADRALWDAMSTEQKTQWFMDQCKKYNLTTNQVHNQIKVNEFKGSDRAYFCVFLPSSTSWRGIEADAWHLEIGGAYATNRNGGIWITNPGLIGKENQIASVMRLHNQGE